MKLGLSIDPTQRSPGFAPAGVDGVTSWLPGDPATIVTIYFGSVYVLFTMVTPVVWTPVLAQSKSCDERANDPSGAAR